MPRKDRRPSRPSARPQIRSQARSNGHQPQRPQSPKRGASPRQASGIWLYGLHAVKAALANPRRKLHRAVLTERAAEEIGAKLLGRVRHETADADAVGKLLPPGAVHQGVALNCEPLPQRDLEEVLGAPAHDAAGQPVAGRRRIVLVLDQLSDPHNTGAILRSAAAFGASAVVVQDRHAPPEAGALAKAASGALDSVPYVSVVNIARALDELAKLGFWRIALAGDGEMDFREAVNNAGDVALVLGSEGAGIRRLVREHCDTAAFLPIESAMESLNVSNAAAIALYELRR